MATAVEPHKAQFKKGETEHSARLWDGTEVFYRAWEPEAPHNPPRALVLVHRGHEHSGRYRQLVADLDLEGVSVFAWDQRGHGRSPGPRGYAPSFGSLTKDLDSFVRWIFEHHNVAVPDMVVLGHSVGAVLVGAWVHDYAPPIRAMVLVTPALRVKLYVPLAVPALRLLNRVKHPAYIKSYVKGKMLTHDPEAAAAYQADPLISRSIAVNILLGLRDTSTRLIDDAAAIRTPTLLLAAGSDWVVDLSAQRRLFDRLGSKIKEMEVFPGFYHALLHERAREQPVSRIRRFVNQAFDAGSVEATDPLPRPHSGAGGDVGPLARLGFAAQKVLLKTIGRLSNGIDIGWKTGFDSGQSLDHVYRNHPEGRTPLGRLIDRVYLNTPGWAGIRTRKKNMEALLDRAIRETHGSGRPVRVLDIAAGPGRYVMETIRRMPQVPITAVLRDRDEGGLEAGRALCSHMGLKGVTHEQGDAFDPASLATVTPRPTIAIVSGLYELFPDNSMIKRSLRGLHMAVEDGGCLLYTNQPWHPQLAFIANVLTNRDGEPWVMRCRSQLEIDRLVALAGFEKIAMETDEQAIFTVSLARKIGRG